MSDIFERVLLLKKSPIFAEVDTDDLRIVAQTMEQTAFFKGDRVFDISEQGDEMYIIITGRVGVSVTPDPAVQVFIDELGPGDCFGEMVMLDDQPRSATIHVLEDARMLTLEKARLRGLIKRYPALALGMLRGVSLRLRSVNSRLYKL
jgi:CRP-like cAMP-binding protein